MIPRDTREELKGDTSWTPPAGWFSIGRPAIGCGKHSRPWIGSERGVTAWSTTIWLDGNRFATAKPDDWTTPKYAMATFAVLFSMHLLDYLDRNLLTSILPQIREDIPSLTNDQWGLLTTIFLVSYSVISPAMGWLGDRYPPQPPARPGDRPLEPGNGRHRTGQATSTTWRWPGASSGSARQPTA